MTAIYNTNADEIARVVADICKEIKTSPMRSDNVFLFQEQGVILEVDSFPLMHHVTLRWEPAAAPLRRVVEAELSRRLSEIAVDDNLLGSWLLTGGLVLLSFDLAGVFFFLRLYMLSMR